MYLIDPCSDPRWPEFLERHPLASAFHTPGWLEALRRTYGYEPVVFTTTPPGREFSNGWAFCRIASALTGKRLVSLPFSDHCDPLVTNGDELAELVSALKQEADRTGVRYAEMRPVKVAVGATSGLGQAGGFCFHRLDLSPSLGVLFRGFHQDCVQRKIKRAERESLAYERGRSDTLLRRFYELWMVSRRRQGLPPQPLAWFRNLAELVRDNLTVHLALKSNQPLASILTLRHNRTLMYKYGCSDRSAGAVGGTQFLLWEAIREARDAGLHELDMGRSDWDNPGLIAFKDRWGASRSCLAYLRYPACRERPRAEWPVRIAKRVFGLAPSALANAAGRIVYRHFG